MSILEAVVLGVLQGVTEFLPISSSGHLVLARWILGWDDPGLAFDAAVHVGTLAALLVAFPRRWMNLALGAFGWGDARQVRDQRHLLALIIVGTIPIVIVGFAVRNSLDGTLRDPSWVGAFLLVTAAMLAAGEWAGRRLLDLHSLDWRRGALVGTIQAVAILPGISRSGFAMVGGLLAQLTRRDATLYAFYLAAPAILGAGIVAGYDVARDGAAGAGAGVVLVAAATSFVTALLAIRALMMLVRSGTFAPFVAYCTLAGVAVLAARAVGA